MSAQPDPSADVTLLLDFLNTVDVEEDTDVLRREGDWQAWALARHVRADPIADARAARAALRAAVGEPRTDDRETSADVRIEVGSAGPALVAGHAVGAVLAAATRLAVTGDWARVKICPADDCRWAFYDRSRNRSRNWCSMRVCGNREKARSWRERNHSANP